MCNKSEIPIKNRRTRVAFTISKDIVLLHSALAYNPWQTGQEKWKDVVKAIEDKTNMKCSVRTIKGQIKLLLKKFKDQQLKVSTGTEEQRTERGDLLEAIYAIMEEERTLINQEYGADYEFDDTNELGCDENDFEPDLNNDLGCEQNDNVANSLNIELGDDYRNDSGNQLINDLGSESHHDSGNQFTNSLDSEQDESLPSHLLQPLLTTPTTPTSHASQEIQTTQISQTPRIPQTKQMSQSYVDIPSSSQISRLSQLPKASQSSQLPQTSKNISATKRRRLERAAADDERQRYVDEADKPHSNRSRKSVEEILIERRQNHEMEMDKRRMTLDEKGLDVESRREDRLQEESLRRDLLLQSQLRLQERMLDLMEKFMQHIDFNHFN